MSLANEISTAVRGTLLVCCDFFRVGGRETHLRAFVDSRVAGGEEVDLAARGVVAGTPEADAFTRCWDFGIRNGDNWLREWCRQLPEIVDKRRVNMIWAQHFDLLPAWIVARQKRIPMVATFHGPLWNTGRPNTPLQALGMTLAIHRSEGLTCVSQEIGGNLADCEQHAPVSVIPNAVDLPTSSLKRPSETPRRFLMVTRRDKLEHVRASVDVFCEYSRRVRGCALTLVCAPTILSLKDAGSKGASRFPRKLAEIVELLGAKWCIRKGPSFLPKLRRMNLIHYSNDVAKLISEHDVVFGMGRVTLEGLVAGRLCCLVGYERPCGIVSEENFSRYQRTNFSGRGVETMSPEAVADQLLQFEKLSPPTPAQLDSIDIRVARREMDQAFENAAQRIGSIRESDARLATVLNTLILNNADESEVFSAGTTELNSDECRTLYRLLKG